jgi:hypothetical protein
VRFDRNRLREGALSALKTPTRPPVPPKLVPLCGLPVEHRHRPENLELVTRRRHARLHFRNSGNGYSYSESSSGCLAYWRHPDGRRIVLGYYDSENEASAAAQAAVLLGKALGL